MGGREVNTVLNFKFEELNCSLTRYILFPSVALYLNVHYTICSKVSTSDSHLGKTAMSEIWVPSCLRPIQLS